jgi:hypothetical protein
MLREWMLSTLTTKINVKKQLDLDILQKNSM